MRLLFLDDMQSRHNIIASKFKNDIHSSIDHVYTVDECIEKIKIGGYDVWSFDHDLGRGDKNDGIAVINFIKNNIENISMPSMIIIHSANSVGSINMKNMLKDVNIHAELMPFFTLIKNIE